MTVKEYAVKTAVSPSTVQRRLGRGEIKGRRMGRIWYVEADSMELPLNLPTQLTSPTVAPPRSTHELISFSSKALNSYLMMSDRLIAEKERNYLEKCDQLKHEQQKVAELTFYVQLLEKMLFPSNRHEPQLPAALSYDPCDVKHV